MSNAKFSVKLGTEQSPQIQPGQFGIVHVNTSLYRSTTPNISRLEGLIVVCRDDHQLITIGCTEYRADFKHLVGKGWQQSTLEKVNIEILPPGTEITIKTEN